LKGYVEGNIAGVALSKISERHVVVGGLFLFAFWLYVALPVLYSASRSSHDETPNKCSAEESKNHGFWEKAGCDPTAYFTIWLVAFTGVLAVSTIGLGWATVGLYRTGEKQIRLNANSAAAQSRDMQASIAVADKAANAAAEQARIVVKTERPYIFVVPLNEGGSPFDPERKVSYFIRNYGRTPAILEKVIVGLRVISDFTVDPDYLSMFTGKTRMVLQPESSPPRELPASEFNKIKPFKPEELAAVDKGAAKMCLIGLVEYRSIHNQILTTGFCFESVFGQGSWNAVGGDKYNYET